MDALWANRPHTLIDASGLEVGLPDPCHHDDAVGPVLTETLLLQRQQGGPLALQGRVAQSDHVRQLRQAGDANQEPGAGQDVYKRQRWWSARWSSGRR